MPQTKAVKKARSGSHPDSGKLVGFAYGNNFISLLPGESRHITIQFADSTIAADKAKLVVDGWNIERSEFRL